MIKELIDTISTNIIGNEFKIKISIATILSGGHILIEDLPGTGKTTFAKSLTNAMNLKFKRIQFTSDLLPSDIIGYTFLKNNEFVVNKGPIFTNIVLADELNRASPKTQSAFLESMEEKTVTIDKDTFNLPIPFSVIATQNPSDLSGTSLLPESQLDRFTISFSLEELSKDQRIELLKNEISNNSIKSNFSYDQTIKDISQININDSVIEYLDNVSQFIKNNFNNIHISPRCLKQTISLSKSLSYLNSNKYVTYQEIKDVLPYILRHRLNIVEKNEFIEFMKNEVLKKVPLPDEK
ncbi:AAA family ATPase [Candidatus Pelagibacter sp. HIMB1521]|uniref:AAA family ATPase n=1 Tax=Candidatus Pelagibacter sp. HIMB1521 TaxID=3413344 RepID=UPI003F84A208